MTDRQFARKRPDLSWHAIAFHTRGLDTWGLDTWMSVCGRTVFHPVRDVLPAGERSCETCLRIIVRRDEQAIQRGKPNTGEDTEDDGSTHDEVEP